MELTTCGLPHTSERAMLIELLDKVASYADKLPEPARFERRDQFVRSGLWSRHARPVSH